MAFLPRALARYATSDRGRSGRSNAYVYSTEDALEAVLAAGYFDAARTRFNLKVGDMIECAAAVKGTPASALLQVASIAGTAVTMAVAAAGAALGLSATRFLKGTASGATIAAVTAQPGWIVSVLANNGVSVSLDPDNRTVKAAAAFGAVATGSLKLRAVSADGRDAVERTFDLSVYEEGLTPPVPTAGRPLIFATGGDSLDQRGMDILGSPNSLTSGTTDPQNLRWPTEQTNRRGGTQRGFTSALQDESASKVMFLQTQHFNGIGGFNSG